MSKSPREIQETLQRLGLVDATGKALDLRAIHAWAYGAGVADRELDAAESWPQGSTAAVVAVNGWAPLTGDTGVDAPPAPAPAPAPAAEPATPLPTPSDSVVRSSLRALGAIDASNAVLDMRMLYDFTWAYGMHGGDMDRVLARVVGLDAWAAEQRLVPIAVMHTTPRPPGWQPPPLFALDVHGPDDPPAAPPVDRAAEFKERLANSGFSFEQGLALKNFVLQQVIDGRRVTLAEAETWMGWTPGSIERAALGLAP